MCARVYVFMCVRVNARPCVHTDVMLPSLACQSTHHHGVTPDVPKTHAIPRYATIPQPGGASVVSPPCQSPVTGALAKPCQSPVTGALANSARAGRRPFCDVHFFFLLTAESKNERSEQGWRLREGGRKMNVVKELQRINQAELDKGLGGTEPCPSACSLSMAVLQCSMPARSLACCGLTYCRARVQTGHRGMQTMRTARTFTWEASIRA